MTFKEDLDTKIADMCKDLGVDYMAVISKRRQANLVEARAQIAQALWSEGFTMTRIGKALNRDHSTVGQYIYPERRKAKNKYVRERSYCR